MQVLSAQYSRNKHKLPVWRGFWTLVDTDIMLPDVVTLVSFVLSTQNLTVTVETFAKTTNVLPKSRFNYSLLNIPCQGKNK